MAGLESLRETTVHEIHEKTKKIIKRISYEKEVTSQYEDQK